MSTSRTSTKTSRKSCIVFHILNGILAKARVNILKKGFLVVSWIRRWWWMVFPRKTFASFLVRTKTFSWSLEINEGDLACFNHSGVFASSSSQSNFLRLSFHASWARRYGWCRVFSSVCSAFDFLCIERLNQGVVGFPWEKGPFTLADKLGTEWNEIKGEIL